MSTKLPSTVPCVGLAWPRADAPRLLIPKLFPDRGECPAYLRTLDVFVTPVRAWAAEDHLAEARLGGFVSPALEDGSVDYSYSSVYFDLRLEELPGEVLEAALCELRAALCELG